jgi:hypothetical protein
MNTSDYQPQIGSFAERAMLYFKNNPDEELTRGDLAQKFDIEASSIEARLKRPIDGGLLQVSNSDDGRVWSAGPKLAAWKLASPAQRQAPEAPAVHRGGKRQRLPPLPTDGLQVVDNMPMPSQALAAKGHSVYESQFEKLTAPGQAVVGIPVLYANTLSKAAHMYCKLHTGWKLKVRRIPGSNPATCGVWRIE